MVVTLQPCIIATGKRKREGGLRGVVGTLFIS